MQVIGTIILVSLAALATANAAGGGGLSEEKKTPFVKDDPVQLIVPKLTSIIRKQISDNLINDTVAQNAVQDAPIEVLSYKSQVVSGSNYFVKVKLVSYIFHLRIYRDLVGESFLQGVIGPVAVSTPIEYFSTGYSIF